ncbi:MAG: hypothetical protein SGI97_11135 [candidate division Zixibacteria bacterium]|nr:hypothetical protein [candidate division Zixibacteria bacterium]
MTPEERATQTAAEFHQVLLAALRQREQEVIKYVAILTPALGGYIWLIKEDVTSKVFQVGSSGVIVLLLIGTAYTLALGYNSRYITLQLAKIEVRLGMTGFILDSWPRTSRAFADRYGLWLLPPDIIKTFYFAFLGSSAFVTLSAPALYSDACWVVVIGVIAIILGLGLPFYFGKKLRDSALGERDW